LTKQKRYTTSLFLTIYTFAMNFLSKTLTIFIFSQLTWATTPREQFETSLAQATSKTAQIHQSLLDLKEEMYAEYFQKKNITKERSISTIKTMLDFSKKFCDFQLSITPNQWQVIDTKAENDQRKAISQRIILSYCEMLPNFKKLHSFFLEDDLKTSQYAIDTEALFESFKILPQFLLKNEERMAPFITVTQVQKVQRPNTSSPLTYNVKTNFVAFYLQEKKRARYLVTSFDALNVEALQLPSEYKIAFNQMLQGTKACLVNFLKKRFKLNDFYRISDFTVDSDVFFRVTSPIDLQSTVMDEGEYLLYQPINLIFPGGCQLTLEQKTLNSKNLSAFYNHHNITNNQTPNTHKNDVRPSDSQKKRQAKKLKSNSSRAVNAPSKGLAQKYPEALQKEQPVRGPLSCETQATNGQHTATPVPIDLPQKVEASENHNPEENKDALATTRKENSEINNSENTTTTTFVPVIPVIPDAHAESIEETLTCLTKLIQDGYALDNPYIIQKAYGLKKNFLMHAETLLEQTQEAVSALATFASSLKSKTVPSNSKTPRFRDVPIQAAADFDRFMTPPLRFLKDNIRFGYVRNLLEKLGAKIDDTRNGSRVHIDLCGHKTSIHIHDKINGLLDSGRIFSIRQLMLDAGFQIAD